MKGEDILFNALRKICVKPYSKLVPPLSTLLQEPITKHNDVKSYAKNSIMWLKQNSLVVSKKINLTPNGLIIQN